MLSIVVTNANADRRVRLRIGIKEEERLPKEDYKNTWEAKILKQLRDNQAEWWSSQTLTEGLTEKGLDAIRDDGQKYAAEKGLTFVCQLL